MKLLISILLIFTSAAFAGENTKNTLAQKIKKGNELFEQQDYSGAQKEYANAQIDAPDNPIVNFNQGDVFYKQKKYDKAIAAYKKALAYPTKNTEAKTLYNIGNCLVQQGKFREALDIYKRANKLDRKDKDIKYNIEFVQLKLKQLEKKKKKKNKDPLNKLLKELEKLIALQSENNVKTKQLIKTSAAGITNKENFANTQTDIFTNQQNYVNKTIEIREGFRDLRTNLPPAKLYGAPGQQGQQAMPMMQGQQALPQQKLQGMQAQVPIAGKQKTLAQKIDNAVGFLATARDRLGASAKKLQNKFTNAPPDQKVGLEYLIKARKEFDDKNKKGGKQKQNQKQKQNKKNNEGKNKDKKDEKKKDKQNKKDQQQNKQNKQKQNKPKQDKQQQQNKQQKQQKQQQEKQPKLDKKQVKQMLKNFKEDQKNKRKARMQKVRATGYVPVDKDW